MDEANRDLLVAVMALLKDAIPPPGVTAALRAWERDRRQSLALLLKRECVLDDERLRALELLATTHAWSHARDLRAQMETCNGHELTHDVLTEVGDPVASDASAETVLVQPATAPDPLSESSLKFAVSRPLTNLARGERFELIREHARGGIGLVWLARDGELQREVALKVIQDCYAEREDQRLRFLLEAEITGNLEHPGIVPVYSLGQNAQGRPYYAMRFIRGESLSAAIRKFHKNSQKNASQSTSSRWGIEFRQLLARFLDVCDAMDYAHSRGVIHRDLKPVNIMLGPFGETLVVDWGLAKVVGRGDVPTTQAEPPTEPDLPSVSGSFSGDTQPGTMIGTPSYMSPEQARGHIELIDPRSDVYSLGVTLYELLTGKVAFPGPTAQAVIDRVLKREFRAPRAVFRSMPKALEAICLKAMAALPADRYPTVRALAQDIEHWLADEPVAAHRERPLERLGRWLRQHRSWTSAAAATLVGISLAATIAALVIEGARQREAEVRKEAEDNFNMARTAVDDYLTTVSEDTLLKEQDSVDNRAMRKKLLGNALKYYQRFVNQRADDPKLRQQLADAYFRVGLITREIESRRVALDSFQSALAIWKNEVADNPGNDSSAFHLAECQLAIGKQQAALDDLQNAMKSLQDARAILEPLASRSANNPALQTSLADCYSEIGILQGRLDSSDQGLAMLEKARAIEQKLTESYPDKIEYQKSLIEKINVMGFVYYRRHDQQAALRAFGEVGELCRSLLARVGVGPKPVKFLDLHALSLFNIGSIRLENGEIDQAILPAEQSLAQRIALVDANPSVNQFRENLGKSYRLVAQIQHKAHEPAKAVASIMKSIEIHRALAYAHGDEARYHDGLAGSLDVLGSFHDEARANIEGKVAYAEAVEEQRLAVDRGREMEEPRKTLSNYLENLGEQYLDLGQVAESLPFYKEVVEIRTLLLAHRPDNHDMAESLARALMRQGRIERLLANADAARVSFDRAVETLEKLGNRAEAGPSIRALIAGALIERAETVADAGHPETAAAALTELVARLAARQSATDSVSPDRGALSRALWELARVWRVLGQDAKAQQVEGERLVLWKGRPPTELVELALDHLNQAALVGYGKSSVPQPVRTIRERELDQGAADLSLAIAHGCRDLAAIESSRDAGLLLLRDDIKPLIKKPETLAPDHATAAPGSR